MDNLTGQNRLRPVVDWKEAWRPAFDRLLVSIDAVDRITREPGDASWSRRVVFLPMAKDESP